VDGRVALLKALAHPLRLRVVDRLGHRGPAPVSQLAVELDVALPELSNGLRQLREAGLVVSSREGRQVVYALADDRLPALLDRLAGARAHAAAPSASGPSRTCYDHLAGPLGVALYRGLLDRGVLRPEADGTVSLVDPAPLSALGIGPVVAGRRRFAFECLDATEHAAHLAGALGDAVASACFGRGWVERGAGREVRLTQDGATALDGLVQPAQLLRQLLREAPAGRVNM
jgi:DNA-binding transcriptional ArsR family regulator